MSRVGMNKRLIMPAEWETHNATLLSWPSNTETWPGNRLVRVEKVYADIIQNLSKFERIILLVENANVYERVQSLLTNKQINWGNIDIKIYPINDVWARDYGPIFVKNEQDFVITDWEFNAWGEKYPPWDCDNNVPEFLANQMNIKSFKTNMILEGGAIDVNGNGDLLTTESVLLNKNRNPELSKNEIEDQLKQYLGVENIIWLKSGLAGDDTDGHIDDITRFLNEYTVLTMVCEDESDVNYKALQENWDILKSAKLANGSKLKIETLPLPKTKIEGTTVDGSEYVPASYANFYIANGCVLVPLYDDRFDEMALTLFQKYFPEREIIGINCADLVWGQGSIHCITQQLYENIEY